jgi:hypothetical protein
MISEGGKALIYLGFSRLDALCGSDLAASFMIHGIKSELISIGSVRSFSPICSIAVKARPS